MEKAVEGGTVAIPELKAAVDGVVYYIAQAGEMLSICDNLEAQPRSVEHFIAKRERVIESSISTLDHLKVAREGVIQYCDSNDQASAEASKACDRFDEAQETLSKLGVNSFPTLLKLNEAYVYVGEHGTSIYRAKDFIRNQYDDDPHDEGISDVAALQDLIHGLKEGIFLLHRTAAQEPYEWAGDVKIATTKVGESHVTYLNSLVERVGNGVMASGFCIDACSELVALMKSVLEDSDKLLENL